MPTTRSLSCSRAMIAALLLAVAVAVGAQTVTPSDATDAAAGAIVLLVSHGEGMVPTSTVVPLTDTAADGLDPPGLTGQLFLANDQTAQQINTSNIAYINCDPSAYVGNLDATSVLGIVTERGARAALFFSQSADYCNVTGAGNDLAFLYSMSDANTSRGVLSDLQSTSQADDLKYFATIQPQADAITDAGDGTTTGGNGTTPDMTDSSLASSNPLGPSPSTAVAMIILYSITGVITALFLVIIVTGALRAHRHPERYGAGVMLGGGTGQRQTRVRGLARAMLETIPIVKFGEPRIDQEPKPMTDLEMGDVTARNSVEGAQRRSAEKTEPAADTAAAGGAGTSAAAGGANSKPHEASDVPLSADADAIDIEDSGIAPATPAASSTENVVGLDDDRYAGCTICTDDFEPGQDVRVLPCDHKFHPACVDPWLLNVSGTCPLCRIDLHPVTSNTSSIDGTRRSASILAPPLSPIDAEAANIPSTHRRSLIREFFSLRLPPDSAEERIVLARRLRRRSWLNDGQAQDQGDGAASREGDDEESAPGSRRRSRLSVFFLGPGQEEDEESVPGSRRRSRLSELFLGPGREEEDEEAGGESRRRSRWSGLFLGRRGGESSDGTAASSPAREPDTDVAATAAEDGQADARTNGQQGDLRR